MAKKCCVLILAATIVALILRLPRLGQRPMHGDEAVHAIKFGQLLEEGTYAYDPDEYHGPTLNYLTLIPARLASATKLTQVTELILRIVPVFFGVLLVLLLLLAADGLAPGAAIYAAILTAISPSMVFYSRYYIQEMLLVCFTFGAIACAYRYTQNKNLLWAILTGIAAKHDPEFLVRHPEFNGHILGILQRDRPPVGQAELVGMLRIGLEVRGNEAGYGPADGFAVG